MLKIKDDVPLEKLKDFGFIKYHNIDDGEYYWCICNLFIGENRLIKQDDNCNPCVSREYELSEYEVEILYDLIQAGLVEKIEEEKNNGKRITS